MKIKMMIRKLSALAVGAAMAFGMTAAGIGASAAQTTPPGYITVNADFSEQNAGIIAALAQGLKNHQSTINLQQYSFPKSNAKQLFTSVLNQYPELFYVDYQYSYSYNSLQNLTYFVPTYNYTAAQAEEMMEEFDEKSDYFLSKITPGMSDLEKALVLHDELILNSDYLLEGTTYSLMVNGRGKCEDYSRAYAFLLAQVGVKCEMVLSPRDSANPNGMAHQWVKVRIDGEYYNVDPTWDDPIIMDASAYQSSGETRPNGYQGKVSHTFFLVSDSLISSSALGTPHTAYTTSYPSPTTYDNSWFRDIESRICCVDGYFYAMASGGSNRSLLISCNSALGTPVTVTSNVFRWSAGNGFYYVDSYSGLDYCDGLFYFNGPDAVYTYDPANGTTAEYAQNPSEDDIYGMRIFNRNVIVYTTSSPSDFSVGWIVGHIDEPLPPLMLGDANGDGVLDINDATLAQRAIAMYETIDSRQQTAADFNSDGSLTIDDVTLIQKKIAHMI